MGELKFEPRNEIQTREWFAAHIGEYDYSIVESGSAFPDYVLEDGAGSKYRVEVESESANFISHRHDPDGCDFVLCWVHNALLPIPVLELSTGKRYEAGEVNPDGVVATYEEQAQSDRDALVAVRRTAAEYATDEMDDFFDCYAADLRARGQYLDFVAAPRQRLLGATARLLRALKQNGTDVGKLHPVDLFSLLVPQVQVPDIGTWDDYNDGQEKGT